MDQMERWLSILTPQLQALVVLAAHDGHMTQAAREIDIPQSSMSRRIHALESELKIPLLLHTGRTVRLTPAALNLVDSIRIPLRDIESAVVGAVNAADPDHGTVRLGFPLSMGSGQIPELVSSFRTKYPRISLTLKQAHGVELTDDLAAGRLDIAVVIPPPAALPHTSIGHQRIVCLVPQSHRLSAAPSIELGDLRDETFIANPASYHLRSVTESWCSQAGFSPQIAFEVTEFHTIAELVARGMGVALLPHLGYSPPGVAEIPLRGDYYRPIALATAASALTPAARRAHGYLLAASLNRAAASEPSP